MMDCLKIKEWGFKDSYQLFDACFFCHSVFVYIPFYLLEYEEFPLKLTECGSTYEMAFSSFWYLNVNIH